MTSDQGQVTSEEPKPRDYKDLLIWQKGIALVKRIYQITEAFSDRERFGLASQMRRAAVSDRGAPPGDHRDEDELAVPTTSTWAGCFCERRRVNSDTWRVTREQ